MEADGRKELKQVKKRRNWHFSMKQANSGQTSQPFRTEVPAFRKPNPVSFLNFAKKGKLDRFVFRPLWLFKDVQNSSPRHPKTL